MIHVGDDKFLFPMHMLPIFFVSKEAVLGDGNHV